MLVHQTRHNYSPCWLSDTEGGGGLAIQKVVGGYCFLALLVECVEWHYQLVQQDGSPGRLLHLTEW
jgi:hypothetical protein